MMEQGGIGRLFGQELVCVNLGVEVFAQALTDQGVRCAQVEWKPPADGDERLLRVLDWLEEES